MAMNKGYLTSSSSPKSDECLTPRYAVEPIVKHLKLMGYKNIWCPFDKDHSKYVEVLVSFGFNVMHSHIDDEKDFFEYEPMEYDCVVSNPPFSIKDKVLERLYSLDKPFAILLPQNSLQSIKRVNMYMKHGMEYLGFDRRINYYIRGDLTASATGNHFASGYFCRNVLLTPLVFEKLNPVQEPY